MKEEVLFSKDELDLFVRERSILFGHDANLHADNNGMVSISQIDAAVPLYVGWIPCLSGQLYFCFSDPSLVHRDYIHINLLDTSKNTGEPKCRYIIASSVFDWKDSGNPEESGLARVVVTAKATTPKRISGDLFFIVIPKEVAPDREIELHRALLETLNDLSETDRALIVGRCSENDYKTTEFAKEIKKYCGDLGEGELCKTILGLSGCKVFRVRFDIDDAGFTYLAFGGQKKEREEIFSFNGLEVANERVSLKTCCRQAFYYLKYLFHKHSHHPHDNDSLTRIHRVRTKRSLMAEAMIRDIKGGLVEDKRAKRFDSCDHMGVATYGKSLVISCQRKGLLERRETDGELQAKYFSNLSDSITILQHSHPSKALQFRSILGTFQQLIVLPFLFLTPSLLLLSWRHKKQDESSSDAASIFDLAYHYLIGPDGVGYLIIAYMAIGLTALGGAYFANRRHVGEAFLYKLKQNIHRRTFLLNRASRFKGRVLWGLNQVIVGALSYRNRIQTDRDLSKVKLWIFVIIVLMGTMVVGLSVIGYLQLTGHFISGKS